MAGDGLHRSNTGYTPSDSAPVYLLRTSKYWASPFAVRRQRAWARPELRGLGGRSLSRRLTLRAGRTMARRLRTRPDTAQSSSPGHCTTSNPPGLATAHERFHSTPQRFLACLGAHDGGIDRRLQSAGHRNLRLFRDGAAGSFSIPSPWPSLCTARSFDGGTAGQGSFQSHSHSLGLWASRSARAWRSLNLRFGFGA